MGGGAPTFSSFGSVLESAAKRLAKGTALALPDFTFGGGAEVSWAVAACSTSTRAAQILKARNLIPARCGNRRHGARGRPRSSFRVKTPDATGEYTVRVYAGS